METWEAAIATPVKVANVLTHNEPFFSFMTWTLLGMLDPVAEKQACLPYWEQKFSPKTSAAAFYLVPIHQFSTEQTPKKHLEAKWEKQKRK